MIGKSSHLDGTALVKKDLTPGKFHAGWRICLCLVRRVTSPFKIQRQADFGIFVARLMIVVPDMGDPCPEDHAGVPAADTAGKALIQPEPQALFPVGQPQFQFNRAEGLQLARFKHRCHHPDPATAEGRRLAEFKSPAALPPGHDRCFQLPGIKPDGTATYQAGFGSLKPGVSGQRLGCCGDRPEVSFPAGRDPGRMMPAHLQGALPLPVQPTITLVKTKPDPAPVFPLPFPQQMKSLPLITEPDQISRLTGARCCCKSGPLLQRQCRNIQQAPVFRSTA